MLTIVPPVVTHQVAAQNTVSEQSPLHIWQGRNALYTIEWTSSNIIAREQNHSDIKQIFNLESCTNGIFEKYRQDLVEEADNVECCNFASCYQITSVVGQYLCPHEQFLGVCEATKSSSQKTFRTINLAKVATKYEDSYLFSNYEALLADIIPVSALIKAFLNNPFIQQAFKAKSVKELSDIQKDSLASIGDFVDAIQARNIYIEDAAGNRNYSFNIDIQNFVIYHLNNGS